MGGFGTIFQSALRGGDTIFFLPMASGIKWFERSRIYRYGLSKDVLSKGQTIKAGGGAVTRYLKKEPPVSEKYTGDKGLFSPRYNSFLHFFLFI